MKPDIIVSWPRNCDYPLWRRFIRLNREKFNEVIIAFTETNHGDDYREFVKKVMFSDYVRILQAPLPRGDEDWRNLAVRASLIHSYNTDWVWFTEQDFYIIDPGLFWPPVFDAVNNNCDVIAIKQGDRVHPACIFIKREALDSTKKDFGIVTGYSDHFSQLQADIERLKLKCKFFENEQKFGYKHFNGLSHNFRLITDGELPNYKTNEFYEYLRACLTQKDVELDQRFKIIAMRALSRC